MLTTADNELLCRIGAGTPMGRMVRRYWIPALQSRDLVAGSVPKRVRLLGEDVVALRGRGERAEVRDERTSRAYPAYEAGGLVWAYLGPAGTEPPPMNFPFTTVEPEFRHIMQARVECNWVQCLEGVIDSSHTNILHQNLVSPAAVEATLMSDDFRARRPSADLRPRMETQDTAYGYRYAAIRTPIVEPETTKYVRVTLFIAPIYAIFPPPKNWTWMQAFVPIDDTHTMFYFIQFKNDAPLDDTVRAKSSAGSGLREGIDLDADYRLTATRENNWLQDRAAMMRGENFSGLTGVNIEDLAVQESMGPLYDRSKEHLGTSDIPVIRMRRLMLDAARRFAETGEPPPGLAEPVPYHRLSAEEKIVPIDTPWQTVGAFAGEPTHATANR
ncbi:MAG TPA: hypothetical protein VHV78_01355 [Gemmatimonadaceae bacterium]|nr:hypothetical protein [Gemmatimonadaceae bacterium]